MAFFLAPRFAPAYAPQCGPRSCGPSRPSYRRVSCMSRPTTSFLPFLSHLDDIFGEIDGEASRQVSRHSQRKRAVRAHFNVHEQHKRYQIDGEVPGFEQDNLTIEVVDDNTLRVAGDTEKKHVETQSASSLPDYQEGVTLNQPEEAAHDADATSHNDVQSHKSHNATVEDDFEDIAAEVATTLSAGSDHAAEPKGKEKAQVDDMVVDNEVQSQRQPQAVVQQQQQQQQQEQQSLETSNSFHGSFERTFRFPERINAAGVTASLRNGLLSITVPQAEAPVVKKVRIQ